MSYYVPTIIIDEVYINLPLKSYCETHFEFLLISSNCLATVRNLK